MAFINLPGSIDAHEVAGDRHFSMNLARGVQVLRAFSAQRAVLGNREIHELTGLPKATVSRLTYTLALLGLLARDNESQKFRLAGGILSLSHPLLASMHVRQVARPLMVELAKRSGCTVNLGMRDRANVVYVDSIRPDAGNAHLPDIGANYPLIASAMGRALIFSAPASERAALLNFLQVHDPQAYAAFKPVLDKDRRLWTRQRYCHNSGDWRKEIHAVAVPIARPDGEPALAMNCTLYAHRDALERLPNEVVPMLKNTVRQLEASQGLL